MMRKIRKPILLFLIILFFYNNPLLAQEEKKYTFIGINPSLTVEPYYNKGEMDINIFPLVYQRSVTKIFDLRLTSIVNLGIRNKGNEISHFGIETAFPIFFKPKENKTDLSKGFFIAPILSLTRNRSEGHTNVGLWAEPGYNLLFEDRFALTFGLQIGATYFVYNNEQSLWRNHFGVKIIFGKWFRKQ